MNQEVRNTDNIKLEGEARHQMNTITLTTNSTYVLANWYHL